MSRLAGMPSDAHEERTRGHMLAFLLLLVVCFSAFANTLENPFISDDKSYIAENHLVRSETDVRAIFSSTYPPFSQSQGLYRPLTTLSYRLNASWVGGLRPYGFHYVNIFLHVVASFLVYLLLRELVGRALVAVAGGLVFAVHPVHTEAVSWIVGRAEILAALFALASLLAGLRAVRSGSTVRFAGLSLVSAGLFGLGVFSKETAAVAPLLFPLLLRPGTQHSPVSTKRLAFLYGGFSVFAAGYLAARWFVLGSLGMAGGYQAFYGMDGWVRLYTMATVFPLYLKLLVFPYPLSIDHAVPFRTTLGDPWVLGGMVLCAMYLAAIGLAARRKDMRLLAGLAWIPAALLPVLNIIPVGAVMAERFLYLPSVGIVMIGALALARLLPASAGRPDLARRTVVAALVSLIVGVFSVMTFQRNADWSDPERFWGTTAARFPESPWARAALCDVLRERGDYEGAIAQCRKAVELRPDLASGHVGLGAAYVMANRLAEAEDALKKAILLNYKHPKAHYNLAVALAKTGRGEEALAHYYMAVTANPSFVEAYNNAGNILAADGNLDLAARAYQTGLSFRPDFSPARFNLAKVLILRGNRDEAAGELRQIIRDEPSFDGAAELLDGLEQRAAFRGAGPGENRSEGSKIAPFSAASGG